MADPEVVDPARQNGIDLRDQHFGRSSTSAPDGLTDFRLDGFAGLLLRSHSNEVSPLLLRTRRRSNPRNPKASPFNRFTTLVFSSFNSTPSGASCSWCRC